MIVLATNSFQSDTHGVCTAFERSIDGGEECVGDIVETPGRDVEMGLTWSFFALLAGWASIAPYRTSSAGDVDEYRRELSGRGLSVDDADRLVGHWKRSGQRYVVAERDGQDFADMLSSEGVDPVHAVALLRQYLLTGERPPRP